MTKEERQYILKTYDGGNIQSIADELDCSYYRVYGWLKRRGKLIERVVPIDEFEVRVIKALYPIFRTEVIGEILGRKKQWVWARAFELDAKKEDRDKDVLSKILEAIK